MNSFTALLFLALMLVVIGCVFWDRCIRRVGAGHVPVTIIVPCFNDASTVGATLRSIFASWPNALLHVMAVNDCSTDGSLDAIRAVAEEFPITIVDHKVNIGKAAALNQAVKHARYPYILCLDADSLLSHAALADMVARLAHDQRVGAVSCPYSPINRGFLPAMQAIEYSMLRLGQGAGNVTSALALWGGCLMVRRPAFESVEGFSVHAITEDVDLAFKLNRAGWRVEQSFVFIRTHVPVRWSGWLRQKVRWTAGGFQCVLAYPATWLRNPLQMTFIFAYAALTITGVMGMMSQHSLWNISEDVAELMGRMPLGDAWDAAQLIYGRILLEKFAAGVGFSLFSLAYVIPTISRGRDLVRLFFVIPFSMAYFPLYLLVSLIGFGFWFVALRRIGRQSRAW